MINHQGSDAPSPTMHELVSWMGYFQLADSPRVQDLGEWFRRRMRQIRWKGWKRPKTRQAVPRKFGINEQFSREWGGPARATGESRALPSLRGYCPTPTGAILACACSSRPGNG
ncbi:group II intron maturase-specific domain-containing protein [Streptomyces sp. NPDC056949]|uniref:group II intron maturase-specific domain-containing protein n=1 Tax=Streptomyces sp. NPDC056949 TaxID=3345976 RepID=UPI003644B213